LEFCPGSNLNVIIGPNGTGKSTIVCAICLGMTGKPSVLGRASNFSDFIKYQKNRAMIEIEL
jgi:chromosome segregation ATPase